MPEDVYEVLTKTAEQMGRPREALVVEWLLAAINRLVNDPLEEFIGAFSSSVPNWADDHDQHIGKSQVYHGNNAQPGKRRGIDVQDIHNAASRRNQIFPRRTK